LGFLEILFTAGCKTDYDENDITINDSLPRPKTVCDGIYEPLVPGLNVAVLEEMSPQGLLPQAHGGALKPISLHEASPTELLLLEFLQCMVSKPQVIAPPSSLNHPLHTAP
jgi:hypothetical protein